MGAQQIHPGGNTPWNHLAGLAALIYLNGHLFVTRVEYSKNIPDKQSTVAHNK